MTQLSMRQRANRLLSTAIRRFMVGHAPKLFDRHFYVRTYPEVAASGIDPFLHFVRYGAAKDYDPSADFDTAYYRGQSGTTPLDPVRHYMSAGVAAGLDPSPAFSTVGYLTRYPDVAKDGVNPLLHFRNNGRAERRVATPSVVRPFEAAFLRGIPKARQWTYPSARVPRFSLGLLRAAPITICTQGPARICLLLEIDGAEIDAVVHGFDTFAESALDSLTLAVDMGTRLHPRAPTLAVTLESCFHGARDADGTIVMRYAEARIWDTARETPELRGIFPPGCLSIRES